MVPKKGPNLWRKYFEEYSLYLGRCLDLSLKVLEIEELLSRLSRVPRSQQYRCQEKHAKLSNTVYARGSGFKWQSVFTECPTKSGVAREWEQNQNSEMCRQYFTFLFLRMVQRLGIGFFLAIFQPACKTVYGGIVKNEANRPDILAHFLKLFQPSAWRSRIRMCLFTCMILGQGKIPVTA